MEFGPGLKPLFFMGCDTLKSNTDIYIYKKDDLLINHFHKIEKKRENPQTCISRQLFKRNKHSMVTLTMRCNKKDY